MGRRAVLLLAVLASLTAPGARGVYALFSASTANPASAFSAKRIFPGTWSIAARDVLDASGGGSEAVKSAPLAAADGVTVPTASNLAASYAAARYVEFDMNSPQPSGLTVSGAAFNFSVASQGGAGSGNACYFFDVRLRSTNAALATHGSGTNAVGCSSGTTAVTKATVIPSVTSTDIANDLRIRVYLWETGGKKVNIDLATVTGQTPYASFAVNQTQRVDATSGIAAGAQPWALHAVDDVMITTANWAGSYSSARYVKFGFGNGPAVPTGAVVTGATLTHTYKATSGTFNYYLELYNGATLLGTVGSTQNPYSAGSSNATDVITLSAVNSPARANNLTVKLYGWNPSCGGNCGQRPSAHDQLRLAVDYYLD